MHCISACRLHTREVSGDGFWLTAAGLQYRAKTESAWGPIPEALRTAPQMVLNWSMWSVRTVYGHSGTTWTSQNRHHEDRMMFAVDRARCCDRRWKVKQSQHHEVARIQSQQYVSQHFQNSCLRRVIWSIRWLEIWQQVVVPQITHKLFGNKPL